MAATYGVASTFAVTMRVMVRVVLIVPVERAPDQILGLHVTGVREFVTMIKIARVLQLIE